MNEKYGIELELITSKFKEKIESIKNSFKGIQDETIDVSVNTAQLEYLKQQIKETQTLLEYNQKRPFMDSTEVLKTQAQLEKLTNQYNKLISKQKQVGIEGKSSFQNVESGIQKATSKIKRFALALFSVRGVYSLLSRASSAYLATDENLSNKIQAAWVGLGAMLEPIITSIVNMILKAVKYINIFIKALTGVDLLAKATSKSLSGTNKSAKALSKTLAGFDELNNIDTTTDSGAGGVSLGDVMGDVEIDTTWADKIRQFGEWVRDNWGIVITALIGTGLAILVIKSGIDLIRKIGIVTMIVGIVGAIISLMKYLKDPNWENFGNIVLWIGVAILGLGVAMGSLPLIVAGIIVTIIGIIVTNWEKIKEFFANGFKWLEEQIDKMPAWLRLSCNIAVGILKGIVDVILSVLDGVFTGVRNIFDGIIMIFKGDFKNGLISIGKGIVNILIGIVNGIIGGVNTILTPFRALIVEGGKILGKNWTMSNIQIPKIPLLNIGTNYVPQDQLAYIHKGEAVVPKKFNSSEYFGQGNDETNSLLRTLIEKVGEIEINPYTTIKDVGKTAVNYINSKNRQLGGSVIN